MTLTRRELIRRLSALSGAGVAGLLPTRVLSTDAGEPVATPGITPLAVPAPGAPPLLWDGASGVSKDCFNFGARLPWENIGGDWSDSAHVAQGLSAYATITFASAGPSMAAITPLVQRWYANGNTGAYLKCTANAAYVATRANRDPALRPVLTLTLSDSTTVQLVSSASTVANVSTSYPLTGETLVVQSGSSMLLQFPLPALGTRTIVNAVLKLAATKIYGTTALKVFELRAPKFFDGGTPVLGLADKYDHDEGVANDPQVYFATQFDETNWRGKWFPIGLLASDSTVVADADLGTPALAVKYHVGETSPCYLNHMWSQKAPGVPTTNAAGTLKIYEQIPVSSYDTLNNQDCPSEVYFRYYLKLKTDYQCAVDGKKLPGIAGRYGYWNWSGTNKGYYQAVNGNGGSPTRGTKILNSGYPGGFYYSGWSMRHHALVGPSDANPYGNRVVASTYAYHAAMKGYYGEPWRWGTPSTGWINYEPERWYCIEQYVKMNTLSGPYDALGNGVGNADGIIRGWVDGVLVFEKKDVVFRKHPAIRVDEIWLDHYHGGTIPAEEEHGFEMANLVVAAAYIGPMRGATTGGPGPGTPPAPPAPPGPGTPEANYQGLWWATGGTESGWGINFVHQGNQVFATWYTYDTAGKAWWLSMLANKTTGTTYAGPIYASAGSPFNTVPFPPMTTPPSQVGTGTLTFKDADAGTFVYTVNNLPPQTKAITRYGLATGAQPTCTYSATTPNFAAASNYQDLWWVADGAESGWGINFAHQGNSVFATWYTYDVDGAPLWLSVLAEREGATNRYTGTLYRTSGPRFDAYDMAKLNPVQVGTAILTFANGDHATFGYTTTGVGGLPIVGQTKQITRFRFAATGGTLCE